MGLIVFKQQGKYGVKNETGEVVVHPRFERIVLAQPWILAWSEIAYDTNEFRCNGLGERIFSCSTAVGGKSQIFFANGSELHLRCPDLPSDICITDICGTKRWSWEAVYGFDLYKAKAIIGGENKACLFKSDGEIVLPFRYDDIYPLVHGYLVSGDSKYEYQNRLAIGGQFNQIVKKRISAKYGVFYSSKEVIPIKFDGITEFGIDDNKGNHYNGEEFFYRVRLNKLYGLLDKEGKTILPTSFSYIDYRIIGEYTRIITYYKGGEYYDGKYARYVKDGKWGFFMPEYDNLDDNHDSGPIFDAITFSQSLSELESSHVKLISENNQAIPSKYYALAIKDNIVGFIVDELRFIPYWELDGYAQKAFLDHNVFYRDDSRVNDNSGWTPDEIKRAYCGAFEMDPNAQWNID